MTEVPTPLVRTRPYTFLFRPEDALDLLEQSLTVDPLQRPSAAQLLNASFFTRDNFHLHFPLQIKMKIEVELRISQIERETKVLLSARVRQRQPQAFVRQEEVLQRHPPGRGRAPEAKGQKGPLRYILNSTQRESKVTLLGNF